MNIEMEFIFRFAIVYHTVLENKELVLNPSDILLQFKDRFTDF